MALTTGGEDWHRNHHHLPSTTRQRFLWWEIDLAYDALVALSWVGVARDLHRPPEGRQSGA